jgi:hypothetical protein
VIADLDTLLTALYVELTDRIIPARGFTRRGPGGRPEVTDAELVCIAVAQVLLRFDDERHWLRAAPKLIGHLFPRLLRQSEYNTRLKAAAPLMEAALRWLADATPGIAELVRLMDAIPVPCGQSVITARRSNLYGYAGYGYCPSHSRWYWGSKLLLICTCDGTVTGFGLANPKLLGERQQRSNVMECREDRVRAAVGPDRRCAGTPLQPARRSAKPQSSIRAASCVPAAGPVAGLPSTAPISVRPFLPASNSRQCPAPSVYPVLIPTAPWYETIRPFVLSHQYP